MDKKEIAQIIENFAPLQLAEDWDPSGWIVNAPSENEVRKVLLCLTVTDDIVKQAKAKNCDMIVSHHPLFFVPFEYKDINIYCAHTNMDRTNGGTTDTIIRELGFNQGISTHDFVRIVKCDITLDELTKKLRKISPHLRYTNNRNLDTVHSIGFCAGSGSEFIDETDCDCYITGDLKFHTAVESKKILIDLGHFESEILILSVFEKLLERKVETVRADEKSPFIY